MLPTGRLLCLCHEVERPGTCQANSPLIEIGSDLSCTPAYNRMHTDMRTKKTKKTITPAERLELSTLRFHRSGLKVSRADQLCHAGRNRFLRNPWRSVCPFSAKIWPLMYILAANCKAFRIMIHRFCFDRTMLVRSEKQNFPSDSKKSGLTNVEHRFATYSDHDRPHSI